MRTATLITYNPEAESYEMSLGTLTTTYFTSYDITCTDDLHVGRNLWVGDELVTAGFIRSLKTTPDTLSLNSLFAKEINVTDMSGNSRGVLSVQDIYTDNVYGALIRSNQADFGVVTCSQVNLGNLTLDADLLSRLMNGSGSSSGGGSVSQETVSADYAYITNFVSARTFRLNGVDSDSGSLQLGTRDFMYVQYDSETQTVNTYARGVFNADNAKIDRLGVRVLTVDNVTFTSMPVVSEMYIASLISDTGRFTSLNSDTGSFTSVSADEGTFDMLKLLETSFDGEFFKIGDDVVFRSFRNAHNEPVLDVQCSMIADALYVSTAFSTSSVECGSVTASASVATPTIKLGNATEVQNNTSLTLDRNYFDTLNSAVESNRTDISNLSNRVTLNHTNISALQTNVSSLQTSFSSFQRNILTDCVELSSRVSLLEGANSKLSGLIVEPSVVFNQDNPKYSLTFVVNNPPEAGGSTQTHRYTCLTAENFDTEISFGDKLSNFMGSGYRLVAPETYDMDYPVGFMGLFVSYNPNSSVYNTGMDTGGNQGEFPVSIYRFTMNLSPEGSVTDPKSLSVSIDNSSSLSGRWRFLTDCPTGWGLVFAIRVS